jgi:hypothetical protein
VMFGNWSKLAVVCGNGGRFFVLSRALRPRRIHKILLALQNRL